MTIHHHHHPSSIISISRLHHQQPSPGCSLPLEPGTKPAGSAAPRAGPWRPGSTGAKLSTRTRAQRAAIGRSPPTPAPTQAGSGQPGNAWCCKSHPHAPVHMILELGTRNNYHRVINGEKTDAFKEQAVDYKDHGGGCTNGILGSQKQADHSNHLLCALI